MKSVLLLTFILLGSVSWTVAQRSGHNLRKEGDRHYNKREYPQAEEAYRRSSLIEPGLKGSYNLGNTVYQQEKFDEAIRQYEQSVRMAGDADQKANALYNMGNSYFMKGQYDKSVQSYKEALKLNPRDLEAKQNLLLAMSQLREQEASSPQQSPQNQSETDETQEDQTESNGPGKTPQGEDESTQNDERSGEPIQDHKKLSKEQVEQLLDIINEEDQKVQEKLRKTDSQNKKSEKDW